MGEVYRAEDTTLGREVALKILPPSLATDAERLARFEREARLLASFNHPGIAGIYGFHESGGLRFIAMELVPGEDLSQRLSRGALRVDEALRLALQIAETLEFAHEHDVIHRDFKPANIKVTPDGNAKVLDFGLAKAAAGTEATNVSLSPTITSEGTRTGTILGTAGYMSPEQARGHAVDRRADIWAFGCVVFEMLTGCRSFPGETVSDTLVSVIDRQPDWSALPLATPARVCRLLERCLDKDPRRRLRDIGEARVALEDTLAGTELEERDTTTHSRRAPIVVAAALAALALFAAGYLLRPSPQSSIHSDARFRRLTFSPHLEQEPSLSPDGNYVAYTTDAAGNLDIEVLALAGGNVNRIVGHPADDAQPRWSPDGSRIAFISTRDRGGMLTPVGNIGSLSPYVQGSGGDLFVMPAMGGPTTKIVEKAVYPSWSPDGTALAFQSDRDGDWGIWRTPVSGGEPVKLTDDTTYDLQPAWSPSGKWIAFAGVLWGTGRAGLYLIPAGGGERHLLFEGMVISPTWSEDSRFVYFSTDRSAAPGRMNLWRVEVSRRGTAGRLQRVTLGAGSDIDAAVSSRGDAMVFSEVHFAPDIWKVDMSSHVLERVTSADSSEDYPHLAVDGRRLAFQSDRGEVERVWSLDLQDGTLLQVPSPGLANFGRWSPDGSMLGYNHRIDGEDALFIHRWGEAGWRTIGTGTGPQWSPDGERLATSDDRGIQIHTLDGDRIQLTDGSDGFPTWSPDGSEIAFHRETEPGVRDIWVVPASGGDPRRLTEGSAEYSHPQWCPTDPNRIVVVVQHKDLATLHVDTGEIEPLTDLASSTTVVDYPSWTPDGRSVYFSLARRTGDIFLIQGL